MPLLNYQDSGPDKKIKLGDKEYESTVHDSVTVNPNSNIRNNLNLKKEVQLISEIIALQKVENIEFCETSESRLEKWGIPNMDSLTGNIYGAKITYIKAPIKYSRILLAWNKDPVQEQYNFLSKIKDKRFLEIQKATGAYQGSNPSNRNQLLDAFHLWCAEEADCTAFLTGEAPKIRRLMQKKKGFSYEPKVVLPSELLDMLDNTLVKKIVRRTIRGLRRRGWLPALYPKRKKHAFSSNRIESFIGIT